jgi:hypothetical protein
MAARVRLSADKRAQNNMQQKSIPPIGQNGVAETILIRLGGLDRMPRLQCKSFSTPDEVRTFPTGRVRIIHLDEIAIGRMNLRPGFRWSKDVMPVVCTPSCQNRHIGYAISGALEVTMNDGTRLIIRGGGGL